MSQVYKDEVNIVAKTKDILLLFISISAVIMIINGFVFSPRRQKRVDELYKEADDPNKTRLSSEIYSEISSILADDTFYLEISIAGFILILFMSIGIILFM